MKRKIYLIGNRVLRQVGEEIDKNYPNLQQIIDDMFETMYAANGVGLAAHQIGIPIKLFIIDASAYKEECPECEDFIKVFINAKIVEYSGEKIPMEEGCLSIPTVYETVIRHDIVHIQYYDRDFVFHDEVIKGIPARILQHEYDHTYGILFTDKISNIRRTMLKKRLKNLALGKIKIDYPVVIPDRKFAEQYIYRKIT